MQRPSQEARKFPSPFGDQEMSTVKKRLAGQCYACGYSLRGLKEETARCPECGVCLSKLAIESASRKKQIRRATQLGGITGLIAILLWMAIHIIVGDLRMVAAISFVFGPAALITGLFAPIASTQLLAVIIALMMMIILSPIQFGLYGYLGSLLFQPPNKSQLRFYAFAVGIVAIHILCGVIGLMAI